MYKKTKHPPSDSFGVCTTLLRVFSRSDSASAIHHPVKCWDAPTGTNELAQAGGPALSWAGSLRSVEDVRERRMSACLTFTTEQQCSSAAPGRGGSEQTPSSADGYTSRIKRNASTDLPFPRLEDGTTQRFSC